MIQNKYTLILVIIIICKFTSIYGNNLDSSVRYALFNIIKKETNINRKIKIFLFMLQMTDSIGSFCVKEIQNHWQAS